MWAEFTAKAELVGTAVLRASSQEGALELLREAAAEFLCTERVRQRYPRLAQGAQTEHGPASEVVAVGEFGVAETGSVAFNEARPDRGQCFLAERLWIVVSEREIEPTLDRAMIRLRELIQAGARHPLLMTGPSRTADIERTLTVGVHGPRELVVLVVEER